MKKYFHFLAELLEKTIKNVYGDLLSVDEILKLLELPKSNSNGDVAFPVFSLSKPLSKNPNEISESLSAEINLAVKGDENNLIKETVSKGPYLNFFLNQQIVYKDFIKDNNKLEQQELDENKEKTIIVEFSSPNIAKPFHIGHIRSTVIGAAISNIYLHLGYKVVRINYLGDYGTQFGKMIVAYKKWGKEYDITKNPIKTLLALYTRFHKETKVTPELEDEAREAFSNLENKNDEELKLWSNFRTESLKEFDRVYEKLGIKFDEISGESVYSDNLDEVSVELEKKNLLTDSKGAKIVDLADYNMTPALIQKSDGASLYITRDIRALIDRFDRFNFHKLIYVVASQQNLHFQQLFKIIELLGKDYYDKLYHVPFGLVSIDGKTLSTRAGEVVFLEDVLNEAINKTKEIIVSKGSFKGDVEKLAEEIGIGAVIFNELSSQRIKDYVFSYDRILNFDGDTGPYVQYTHTRLLSVIKKSGLTEEEIVNTNSSNETSISDEAFIIVKEVLSFNDILKKAADENEPSILSRYILDLSKLVNKFYANNKILSDNYEEKIINLLIILKVKNVIRSGLSILGLKCPNEM